MLSVLIVEDDKDLGRVLDEQFTAAGFTVFVCQSVMDYKNIKVQDFAAAVVDLNLPDGSGFDIVKSLTIPKIIMTALNTPENRLKGIELGAHDFIPKPFLFKELQMKLERLLSQRSRQIKLVSGGVIDLVSRTIDHNGGTVFLNDREYRILNFLIERAPNVMSRDDILDYLKGDETASHRSIDNVIVKLRHMLGDEEHNQIKSVRSVGYQWVGGKA